MNATVGIFPKSHKTIIAEVLARLLTKEDLTGMDAVRSINTTRLASPVCTLRNRDAWPINDKDLIVQTSDGRVETVSVYYLDDDAIEAAMAVGGAEFCASVKEARAELRKAAR